MSVRVVWNRKLTIEWTQFLSWNKYLLMCTLINCVLNIYIESEECRICFTNYNPIRDSVLPLDSGPTAGRYLANECTKFLRNNYLSPAKLFLRRGRSKKCLIKILSWNFNRSYRSLAGFTRRPTERFFSVEVDELDE